MKTVIVPAPGKIEIRQVETPVINAYQALVKTEMVALCNATDSKLVAGKFPGVDTYPLALGHENAGIVVAVGEKVRNFKMGDRVIGGLISDFGAQGINSGWGGFSEYVVVNDFEVLKEEGLATPEQGCWDSFEIQNAVPSHVQPEEAVISCTWREVLGAFKDFNLTPGKKVIVVGSGPVGLSFVKLGKLFAEISTPEFIAAANRSYDAVIDAVGLDAVVNSVLPLVKMGGDVCVYGVMTKNPTFDLSKAPYNFDLHMHQWPTRSEEKAAMTTLAQWIEEGKLSASDFITHRFTIEEIEEAFAAVKRGEVLKCVLTF